MNLEQQYSLDKLAELLNVKLIVNNKLIKQIKPAALVMTGLNNLERAKTGEISFLINKNYAKQLATTQATAVIIPENLQIEHNIPVVLVAANPRLTLVKLIKLVMPKQVEADRNIGYAKQVGIHVSSLFGKDCDFAENIIIGPNCVIGDRVALSSGVVIGANTVIGHDCYLAENVCLRPNVTLYNRVNIDANTIIHSSSVIGGDGFGYAEDSFEDQQRKWVKMPHVGGVKIGSNVEIGSNVSIDRGFIDDTEIGDNVIIDNLVQIGHNVQIGSSTAIAGCVAIAGSATVGKNCLIGGAARIVGHIVIEDGTIITAASNVNRSLKKGIYSSAFPAKESDKWRRNVARFNHLDELAKKIRGKKSELEE